ncbi:hypothetical protein AYK26_03655 [Euryarchaeota archaeon SM23-78]|nr:MAG: hypothetical protein AYK26_03655 [Euryarchaeota archaeon SM23-78]MBW3000842.1 hypothetical protein [Candidatus Woesearchaeota archaeon]
MMSATEKKRKENNLLIASLILIIIILSTVMFIRLGLDKPLLSQGESYYNLRISEALKKDFFLNKDPLQETIYEPNPHHYLASFLLIFLPVKLLSFLFPLILGLLSGLLFYKLLILLKIKPKNAAYSVIVLAVTPAFIILYTGLYLYGFALFLSLLILVLFLNKKQGLQALGGLLLPLLAWTNLTAFLITFIILLFLYMVIKRNLVIPFLSLIISALVIFLLTLLSNYTPRILGFHGFAFRNILSVLKADIGFDLFLLILFLTGFVIVWIKDEARRLFYMPVLALVALSLFNTVARIYINFIITVYCVSAITYFYKRKWDLKIIRTGTMILVLCSLAFSVTNQANLLVDAQPSQEVINSLDFLKNQLKGKVLTTEKQGFLVEYYSNKPVLLDSNSYLHSNYSEIRNDINALFSSVRLLEAEPLLKKHELKYILITPTMKEELWENREQGLWFLMKNSEGFINKYTQNNTEIWEYVEPREND